MAARDEHESSDLMPVLALSRAGHCPCSESLGTAELLAPRAGAQDRDHLACAQQSNIRTGCPRAAPGEVLSCDK